MFFESTRRRIAVCGKNLLFGFLFLLGSLSLSGQSFDPKETYEVTGAWLIERQNESKIANEALKNSKAENELLQQKIGALQKKLDQDSTDREARLTEVSTQLKEASMLFQRLQNEALSREIVIGGVAIAVGFAVGWGVK